MAERYEFIDVERTPVMCAGPGGIVCLGEHGVPDRHTLVIGSSGASAVAVEADSAQELVEFAKKVLDVTRWYAGELPPVNQNADGGGRPAAAGPAGFADADALADALTGEQRLDVAAAIRRRGHQELADIVRGGLSSSLSGVAGVVFTTAMEENGTYYLDASDVSVYYSDPLREPDSFDFGFHACRLVDILHGQVNHKAWLGMIPATGQWCLVTEAPVTGDIRDWPIDRADEQPAEFGGRRVCRCGCVPHRGRPRRDDLNHQDCRCTLACDAQPLSIVVPQWGSQVLFMHPGQGSVWGVDWVDGRLDWANASEVEDVADIYEAVVAIGGLMPAIERLVATHEMVVKLT